jgi:hypothetical protein
VGLALKVSPYFFQFLRSVSVTAKGTFNLAGKLAQANHPVEQLRNQLNKIGRGGGVRLSPVSTRPTTSPEEPRAFSFSWGLKIITF